MLKKSVFRVGLAAVTLRNPGGAVPKINHSSIHLRTDVSGGKTLTSCGAVLSFRSGTSYRT